MGCAGGYRLEPGNATKDASCVLCAADEVSPVDAQTCTKCSGDYHPNSAKIACQQDSLCSAGTRRVEGLDGATDDSQCIPCAPGQYYSLNDNMSTSTHVHWQCHQHVSNMMLPRYPM